MATRERLGTSTFDEAINRMLPLYEQGHRIVVSFSAGKDSTCLLETCIIAARLTGRLPVEVVLQDEEIAWPGTYEYAIRTAMRPEVKFTWVVMNQPMINCFNRTNPYFWVFDPALDPEEWVRKPPTEIPQCNVQFVREKDISMMTHPGRFPPDPGKQLYAAIGLRVAESRGRLYGYFSSGGHITKPNRWGVRNVRPIADWGDGDVWKAIGDNNWDYNKAYDTFLKMGVPRKALRCAPPTMNPAGLNLLMKAAQAWPQWFSRVAKRLPGVRTAAHFGSKAVLPERKWDADENRHETWEECFKRSCIDEAPPWIAARAKSAMEKILSNHHHHATTPLPEVSPCRQCNGNNGCWKSLAMGLIYGDPFSTKFTMLPYAEPELFRPGAGTWGTNAKISW